MDQPTSLKPERSDSVAILAGIAMTLTMGAICYGGAALADTLSPVTSDDTRIVRAIHGTSCDARVISAGVSPRAAPAEDLDGLNVSCTDDASVGWDALRKALAGTHACAVVLSDLKLVAPAVRLVRDPTESNPYHCTLSQVTPNQFVSRSSWQP